MNRLLTCLCLLGLAGPALAQFQVFNLSSAPAAGPVGTRPTALSLPFFDDFSLVRNGLPDASLWEPAGGTVITNHHTDNHPTVNVAAFDGLLRSGRPYDAANAAATGAIDTLASQPIDLGGLSATDSVYLSFFYAKPGPARPPDSLRLQLLDAANQWVSIWLKDGTATTGFTQQLFYISQARFLHGNFRFRLLAYGGRGSPQEGYYLDYVYLNKNRDPDDRYYKDIALRKPVGSYLKRYRHMPLTQYRANPTLETAASIGTDFNNLYNNNNFITTLFQLRETTTGAIIQSYRQPVSENVPQLSAVAKTVTPQGLPASFAGTRAVLESRFEIVTTDDQNPSIPGINLRRNDTLSALTVLDDFFAYDDGSAEQGVFVSNASGQLAIRFDLNADDILRAVQLHHPLFSPGQAATKFTLLVMQDAGGQPGTVLRQQDVTVQYAPQRNAFTEYKLASPVPVSGAFWVGLRPIEPLPLAVGIDRNSSLQAGGLVSNTGSGWVANNTLTGALMLRAVVGGRPEDIITGLPATPADFVIWPNPGNGRLRWQGGGVRRLEVLTPAGQVLYRVEPRQPAADFSQLPAGRYLLRFQTGTTTLTRTYFLQKH